MLCLWITGTGSTLLGDLARWAWEGLALGLAYGLLSMASLQLLKDLYLRRAFNLRLFNHWFEFGSDKVPKNPPVPATGQSAPSTDATVPDARADLLTLACAGDEDALFGLPIEKLAGQINVAASSVIETPKRYPALLTILAYGAKQEDVTLLLATDPPALLLKPAKTTPTDPEQENQARKDAEAEATARSSYADARTRVSHHIQRTIDALQLSAQQRWTRLNQWLSIGGCALLGLLIGLVPLAGRSWFANHYGIVSVATFLPISIVLALIGGCLAPLLRDLTAGLGQAK